MIIKNIIVLLVLFFLSNTSVFSQVDFTKHQLAINASKFLVVFNEEVNILDLTYRLTLADSAYHLRMAGSLDLNTEEDALTDFSARIGIDKIFKVSKNWIFYYGADANFGRTVAKSANRTTTKIGVIPFIGILFHLGPHFSFSTEPSIAFFRNQIVDKDGFIPTVNSTDYAIEFINMGQIKVGFHF